MKLENNMMRRMHNRKKIFNINEAFVNPSQTAKNYEAELKREAVSKELSLIKSKVIKFCTEQNILELTITDNGISHFKNEYIDINFKNTFYTKGNVIFESLLDELKHNVASELSLKQAIDSISSKENALMKIKHEVIDPTILDKADFLYFKMENLAAFCYLTNTHYKKMIYFLETVNQAQKFKFQIDYNKNIVISRDCNYE